MLADGASYAQMERAFDIAHDTVRMWKKRDDVRRVWTRIIQERAIQIRSHTDTRILKLLESGKELTPKQLLEIRDSFASDAPSDDGGGGTALVTRLMEAAAQDPVLARRLQGVLSDDDAGS